jgi:hypothetical protein
MAKQDVNAPKSPYFDIKAEILAARLIGLDWESEALSLENILMAPIGDEKRRSSRDVSRVRTRYFDHENVLQIEMNRKGFYDSLPLHLFHKLDKNADTPKKRTRALQQQEAEARKFFLPFEQASFAPRVELEMLEQKYFDGFPDFIREIWGLDQFEDLLSKKQEYLFCHLLPEAYRVVGDWELTQLIFEASLGKPIELRFTEPETIEIESVSHRNEELRLGEDSVLGSTFRDEFLLLEIVLKGITRSDLDDFLPKGKTRRIIDELLCSYFIPLDVPYKITLEVTEDSMGFDLGQITLGYNTTLVD